MCFRVANAQMRVATPCSTTKPCHECREEETFYKLSLTYCLVLTVCTASVGEPPKNCAIFARPSATVQKKYRASYVIGSTSTALHTPRNAHFAIVARTNHRQAMIARSNHCSAMIARSNTCSALICYSYHFRCLASRFTQRAQQLLHVLTHALH